MGAAGDTGRRATHLADMTTEQVSALLSAGKPVAVLLPVGSVEPHGPHLPLGTDTLISETAAVRAIALLAEQGILAVVGPAVPYGVTDFAAGFAGAISVPAAALTAFLRTVVEAYLRAGFAHVCLVNNHLEPAHDAAVRAAASATTSTSVGSSSSSSSSTSVGSTPSTASSTSTWVALPDGSASVACPLTRRWARTLSAEFKSGACHAGQYETSLVLAANPNLVDVAHAGALPAVPVSLSEGIKSGKRTFRDMGMHSAYAGAPAAASPEEGDQLYSSLAAMVVGEVSEALSRQMSGG